MEKSEKLYKQLSAEERATIILMAREGKGVREVERFLKHYPSTSNIQKVPSLICSAEKEKRLIPIEK